MKKNKLLLCLVIIQFVFLITLTLKFKYDELRNIYIFKSLMNDYNKHFDLTSLEDYGFRSRSKTYTWHFNNLGSW